MQKVEADDEAEEVQLDALARADGDAEEAEQRKLEAAAGRGARSEFARRQIVLANGRRRQIDMHLRQRSRQIGGEGVAVRPRPQPVFGREWIAANGLAQALD